MGDAKGSAHGVQDLAIRIGSDSWWIVAMQCISNLREIARQGGSRDTGVGSYGLVRRCSPRRLARGDVRMGRVVPAK